MKHNIFSYFGKQFQSEQGRKYVEYEHILGKNNLEKINFIYSYNSHFKNQIESINVYKFIKNNFPSYFDSVKNLLRCVIKQKSYVGFGISNSGEIISLRIGGNLQTSLILENIFSISKIPRGCFYDIYIINGKLISLEVWSKTTWTNIDINIWQTLEKLGVKYDNIFLFLLGKQYKHQDNVLYLSQEYISIKLFDPIPYIFLEEKYYVNTISFTDMKVRLHMTQGIIISELF